MLDEFGFIWYNNYRDEVLNLLVEYDATSQPDLNSFAKHLNDAVPNNLEWNTFSAFDKCDWPKPDKYYWVIGITKNIDMELQYACEKRKFTTYEHNYRTYADWTDMNWINDSFEAFWYAEIK